MTLRWRGANSDPTKMMSIDSRSGILLERGSMVWRRGLKCSPEKAWEAISTAKGLSAWWLVPQVALDLHPGGLFEHEWTSRVRALEAFHHLDLEDLPLGTGGMRFELERDGEQTLFTFIDSWGECSVAPQSSANAEVAASHQPGGPGTPWAGAAARWHQAVDALEASLTGARSDHSYAALVAHYARYLSNHFRWCDLITAKRLACRAGAG